MSSCRTPTPNPKIVNHWWNFIDRAIAAVALKDPGLRAPLAVCLGAIPGALSRYYLAVWCQRWWGTDFPFGTFFANLSGAFLMGLFVTFALERAIASPDLRLLVAVGFLGSYTTFSSYALETSALWHAGARVTAIGYGLSSAILGLVGLEIGSWLAKRLF
ncbi:MAG TPA: fluoride efflux transporter CrcB [Oscillatoriales cyanobacterium M59_W2019_021]|nr:MAG: fluoride efflux transporter CrcB [Cyanobacteria bacterium J055]HIK33836.1 fluoride efflux transporter CrcB [Oscillatoriales cyanobacterium M4454_W2019_049]HIK50686.1 fluoride efflux transporter CrcB [Oscillatoriales cyanobacterium M59_W2019_021]